MQVIFTPEPLVIPSLALPSREVGAVVEFLGLVREQEQGLALEGLHYEAYEPMARREFAGLAAELRTLHLIAEALVIHRLGWVPVGEASLFIRVLAKHRAAALHFCEALIDQMKQTVPIWKVTRPTVS